MNAFQPNPADTGFVLFDVLRAPEVLAELPALAESADTDLMRDQRYAARAEEERRMRAALAQMSEKLAARDLLAYSECNKLFHQVIYDACPNRAAVDLVMSLKSKISKFNAKTILIPGRDQQSFEEHRGILAAIEDRDAQAASRLLREHIRHVTEKIEEYDKLIF